MARSIQHASWYLRSGDAVSSLVAATRRDAELLTAVRRVLPPPLDRHCLHATLDHGELVLTTDAPTWASRLRFATPDLLTTLAGKEFSVGCCRIRVQPSPPPHAAGEGKQRGARLSPAAARHLAEAARATEDPELAEALRRLARAGGDRG
ncbi:MAG: DciA family protein [Chromatiaceae bacterium]|jgi:hypothetical protein